MGLTGCEYTHRSADPHYRNRSFGRDPKVASQPRTQLPIRLTRTGLMVSHEDSLGKRGRLLHLSEIRVRVHGAAAAGVNLEVEVR